jgi:hypothetical protein
MSSQHNRSSALLHPYLPSSRFHKTMMGSLLTICCHASAHAVAAAAVEVAAAAAAVAAAAAAAAVAVAAGVIKARSLIVAIEWEGSKLSFKALRQCNGAAEVDGLRPSEVSQCPLLP